MLRTIIRRVMQFLRLLMTAPGRTLRSLVGGGAPMPPTPEFEEVVDEQVEELREELDRKPELPVSLAVQSLGERIHRYVDGTDEDRRQYDFGQLPDHVAVALLGLTTDARLRLRNAGPTICGRWGLGEKTGLVGVPPCRTKETLQQRVKRRLERAADTLPLAPAGEAPAQGREWRLA